MSALSIQPPYPEFAGTDGQPLENGYIWIGEPNLNSQTNQKSVYYDSGLTIPASQPIRTLNGYISRSGTPANIYVDGDYSISVFDKNGSQVYTSPSILFAGSDRVIDITILGAGRGGADDSAIIQSAVDLLVNLGGGTIYFPPATYNLQNQVIPKSNVNYRGEGKNSSLVWNSTSGGNFFNQASTDLENATWDGIGFDGTINYITDPTIYKQTYTRNNTAIRTSGVAAKNVTVKNCYFENLSNRSIDFNGEYSDGISILDNTFINGCYVAKVINVRIPSSLSTDAARPQNILIRGNMLDGGGPTAYYDASKEDWTASTDGIVVDSCKDVIIAENTVVGIASTGIRVEQTLRGKVIGNTVKESGSAGIIFYNESFDGVCVGNTVQNWGRIPPAYAIRSFGGSYYAAQEFPDATLAPLPADPSVSAWFYVWPYALTGVNASTIIAYANTQYYPGTNGILPYRGEAAIGVTQGSQKINVVGNNIVGNITTSGGLYNYSSDYGISCIHPSNDPGGQLDAPLNSMITGNGVVDMRVYRIWHPEFADPIHYNTASYDTGTAVYSANRDSSSSIWSSNVRFAQDGQLIAKVDAGSTGRSNFQANWVSFPATAVASADANTLDDYEEGTWTPSLIGSTGASGQTYTRTNGAYTKIGRQVTCTFEVQLSAVGIVSGTAQLGGLPFPVGNSRRYRTGLTTGRFANMGQSYVIVNGQLVENTSVINLYIATAAATSLSTPNATDAFTNTTAIEGSFTYFTV
jgi:hypothetical protein